VAQLRYRKWKSIADNGDGLAMSGMRNFPPVSLGNAALTCACPGCGQGKLFTGLLAVAPRCLVCGLDFRALDTGDGATGLVVLLVGAVTVGLALMVEIWFAPPVWMHILLWTPTVIAGTILLLRPLKAGLIALQYRANENSRL
jgi:uncharacterized protein (DUF983 family)